MSQEAPLSFVVIEHAWDPRNYGEMLPCDGHAKITGPCGDTMEFWVRVRDDRIVAIGFTTTGCGTSRAAGSMTSELASGRSLTEAQQLGPAEVLDALDGLPAESQHCALLATDTLRAAINDFLFDYESGGPLSDRPLDRKAPKPR